jgi:ATP-dependent protease HslVU (ClpYQ) peptidase subunit
MTCIVGVKKNGTVWLGGDSAATSGNLDRTIIKDPKVFDREDKIAFGVCGLPKVMDAVRHAFDIPEHLEGMSDRSYLTGVLVPAMREKLKELDCTQDDPNYGTCFHGSMLVGYHGELYTLEGNFQIVVSSKSYASVGSGAPHALGALASKSDSGNPKKRIINALEAACNNAGVAPPFVIVSVK